jgi:hypothetical protein
MSEHKPLPICYLCGLAIPAGEETGDHVVPKQLIQRQHPKAKGFDYAGVLPSHQKCNNEFGPESYVKSALELIRVLHDDNCFVERQHRDRPEIKIMGLNQECLKGFTKRDLGFFKIIDVRHLEYEEFTNPAFFEGKPKTNPLKQALHTALAVLTKSAAAILVSRNLRTVPPRWRVVAMMYQGDTSRLDMKPILGDIKPFDIGLEVWVRPLETGDWVAVYKTPQLLLFVVFWFSGKRTVLEQVQRSFGVTDCLLFDGERLMDLTKLEWVAV